MREWFGAVRTAADLAVKQLGEQTPLNAAQKRKADILLRQLLADELPELAAEAEGFDETRAQKLKKDVYSELMEDALAGTGFGWEDMELLRFLDACSRGVTAEEVFLERFGQVLGPHALSGEELIGTASRVRVSAEQKLHAQADQVPGGTPGGYGRIRIHRLGDLPLRGTRASRLVEGSCRTDVVHQKTDRDPDARGGRGRLHRGSLRAL